MDIPPAPENPTSDNTRTNGNVIKTISKKEGYYLIDCKTSTVNYQRSLWNIFDELFVTMIQKDPKLRTNLILCVKCSHLYRIMRESRQLIAEFSLDEHRRNLFRLEEFWGTGEKYELRSVREARFIKFQMGLYARQFHPNSPESNYLDGCKYTDLPVHFSFPKLLILSSTDLWNEHRCNQNARPAKVPKILAKRKAPVSNRKGLDTQPLNWNSCSEPEISGIEVPTWAHTVQRIVSITKNFQERKISFDPQKVEKLCRAIAQRTQELAPNIHAARSQSPKVYAVTKENGQREYLSLSSIHSINTSIFSQLPEITMSRLEMVEMVISLCNFNIFQDTNMLNIHLCLMANVEKLPKSLLNWLKLPIGSLNGPVKTEGACQKANTRRSKHSSDRSGRSKNPKVKLEAEEVYLEGGIDEPDENGRLPLDGSNAEQLLDTNGQLLRKEVSNSKTGSLTPATAISPGLESKKASYSRVRNRRRTQDSRIQTSRSECFRIPAVLTEEPYLATHTRSCTTPITEKPFKSAIEPESTTTSDISG